MSEPDVAHRPAPTAPPPRRPEGAGTFWWWALLCAAPCIGVTFGALWLAGGWDARSIAPGRFGFEQPSPAGRAVLLLIAASTWAVVTWRVGRATGHPLLAIGVAVTLLAALWSLPPQWTTVGKGYTLTETQRTEAAGRTYVVHDVLGKPGSELFGVVERSGLLSETVRRLGLDARGWPLRAYGQYGYVLLPAGASTESGATRIVRASSGGVVFVEHADPPFLRAVYACDAEGTPAVADPFSMFGPDDVGPDGSREAWILLLAALPRTPQADLDAHLRRALAHPNAWVRALAADGIDAAGADRLPRATQRLREIRGE